MSRIAIYIYIYIFQLMIFRENALMWIPQDLIVDWSTLVQVMGLSQCWIRSVSPYDVTRPQWVNVYITLRFCKRLDSNALIGPLVKSQSAIETEHTEVEWRIYVSVNWIAIGSGNGLSPMRCQAITWTNTDSLSYGSLGTHFTCSMCRCSWVGGGRRHENKGNFAVNWQRNWTSVSSVGYIFFCVVSYISVR